MHKIMFYSGVGSRETPTDIMNSMMLIAYELQGNYTLRSGHAPGADSAFEEGISNGNMEIYIPWKGFNGSDSKLFTQADEAFYIASQYHPNWKNLKEPVKKLMARNVHQVLGQDLKTPAEFVLCWTQDGCESHQTRSQKTGGTGQAISIASENNIEIINMKNLLWEDRLLDIIGNNYGNFYA
jgi:hypothetical protein